MLDIEGLTVTYGSVTAVRDLSLRCEQGEIVALIGPNGSGKSSTLLAASGVLPASSVRGTVRFLDERVNGRTPESVVRLGLAFVPESRRIFGTLTVEENLLLGATTRRDRGAIQADVERLSERFPVLGRKRKSQAGALSGGEQQQLAIARALMGRPKLVMLDEPSLGLAPVVIDEMFDLIVELRKEGTTVLLVEQNALRALEVSDRCYVLQHGGLQLTGRSSEVIADRRFIEAYFGGSIEMEVIEG